MKKLLFLPIVLLSVFAFSQEKMPKKEKAKTDTAMRKNTDKVKDAVDETMKGPNGEKVYTGPKGGKYYMKGTQKVYLPSTTKKKSA